MKLVKRFGILTGLAGLGVLAIVYAPPIAGQARPGRDLTVLAGRGAEIGVFVRDEEAGVTIDEVRPDSPAEKAGLKRADVIVEFDGEHVRSARQFSRLVQETAPGRRVKATILRDTQKKDVELVVPESRRADAFIDGSRLRDRLGDLGDRLAPFNFNFDFDLPEIVSGRRLGALVLPLTRQLSTYFGAPLGLLVTAVTDGSPAARAGLKAGDVITSVNGQRVESRADLQGAIGDAPTDKIELGIVRDKKESTITATVESPKRKGLGLF